MTLTKVLKQKVNLLFILLFLTSNLVIGQDACNVNITSANGGVTITGLTSASNTKLFNSDIQDVWSCNPWQGNPCSGTETVSGLISGATYFLSVQSDVCEEWIPITIQGGGTSATCSDGIQNQGETGVDCGGPCAPCATGCNVSVTSTNGGVNITGLTGDANTKLFNSDIQSVWSCNPWQGTPCSGNETVPNLVDGATYFLSVQSDVCEEWIPITIQGGGGGCNDTDGDGICDTDDCQPNNPSLPGTPGFVCNDFNSSTSNDRIQPDGCSCQGTVLSSGCNVTITSENGGVTIAGLTSDLNTKLFDANTEAVWGCNPWQGSPCSGTETVSGLISGATYFLSVQRGICDKWIPITIQGGGGGNENLPDLVSGELDISRDEIPPGETMSINFTIINIGNDVAVGSTTIATYISTDPVLSSDDIQVAAAQISTYTTSYRGFTETFGTPNIPAGNYYVLVVTDDDNNVAESNENNNVKFAPFAISECNLGNVARSKSADQSSRITVGGATGAPSKAVDGNTDGNFSNGSVTTTREDFEPFWQCDLGSSYDVVSIEIFNRTDGINTLSDFYVLTSNEPFENSSRSLAAARNQATNERFFSGQAGTPTTWTFSAEEDLAKYVRIQKAGFGYISMAEVKVNACGARLSNSVQSSSTSTSSIIESTFSVEKLFPNPSSGELFTQIESSTEVETNIQVVNLLGQVTFQKTMQLEEGNNSLQLNLENLSNGIYHVTFMTDTDRITRPFVISK